MIQQSVTRSGIRVVSEDVPGARSVCSGVWVGVGSRDEPEQLAGVSHFLEHLLFKGTSRRSAQDIARSVDRVGGDMNAYTTKEYTAYYTRLPAGSTELGLALLGDVLSDPRLDDADVESERHVIAEELAMDDDTPDDKVHTLLAEALFPGHPLGRETAGHRDTVASIRATDVRDFFDHWYRPANMVVAVAGAVEHGEAVDLVEAHFTRTSVGMAPERSAPSSPLVPTMALHRSVEQSHLAIGYHTFDRHDADREALDVLNHTLGGGMSSRLFDEIRDRRGLAYSVWSGPISYADAGALTIYAGTAPEHVAEVAGLIDVELTRIRAEGITDEELEVAVGYLVGSSLLGLEDASSRMARLGGQLTVRGALIDIETQLDRYRAVSADDVVRVAERVLCGSRSVALVGPKAHKMASRLH